MGLVIIFIILLFVVSPIVAGITFSAIGMKYKVNGINIAGLVLSIFAIVLYLIKYIILTK